MNEPHFAALLENREWLRRLAGRLVRDPNRAEDVVQQTLAIGVERGPNEPSRLRGWLRTVLHNEVRGEHRRGKRREARERRVARPESATDGDALVERLELQKRVTEAVLTLDESFREVVLLRYVDDKSPSEIARELDLPAATVRTRLHRAHDRLRQRLDGEYGGRARWQPAMLALTAPGLGASSSVAAVSTTAASTTLVTIGGAIAVKKFVIAAALIALVVCGIQFGPDLVRGTGAASSDASLVETDSEESGEEPSIEEPDGAASASDGARARGADVAVDEASNEDSEVVESIEDVDPDGIPDDVAVVYGHIECSDGRSYEGEKIFLWGGGQPSGIIDENNDFSIESPFDFSTWVMLVTNGVRTGVQADVRPLFGKRTRVDIFVEVGHELDVVVVEKGSGRPVAYQEMVLRRRASNEQASSSWAESDAHGRVRFALLPEADYTLEISPENYTYFAEPVRVPADTEFVAELAAPRDLVVVLENYAEHPPQDLVYAQFFARERPGQSDPVGNRIEKAMPDASGRLVMRAPPPGRWIYDFFAREEFPRKGGRVEIPESGPIPELVVELPSVGTTLVTGVLRTPGERVVSSGVLTIGQVGAIFRDDGSFEADRVKPGKCDIWFDEGLNRRYMLESIEVPNTSAMHGIEVELPGDETLRITVEGMPLHLIGQEVEIRLRPENADSALASGYETVEDTVEFSYLAPGRYSLRFARKTWTPAFWTGIVEVEPGTVNEVTVQHPGVVPCPFEIEVPDGAELPTRIRVESDYTRGSEGRIFVQTEVHEGSGEFEFPRIGEIRARVIASGFEPAEVTFDAPEGDGAADVLKLRLVPAKE